jgi:hypothetical protein
MHKLVMSRRVRRGGADHGHGERAWLVARWMRGHAMVMPW